MLLATGVTAIELQSPVTQVRVVELYTSEGCSSCPPAEGWLRQLDAQPALWRGFVPLALHVGYWDRLGWPDPFAHEVFEQRQRTHARLGNAAAVYTPGMLLDGRAWEGWRERPAPPVAARPAGRLRLRYSAPEVDLRWTPEQMPAGALTAHAVLLGHDIERRIQRGENQGRVLRHGFVVLAHASAGLTRSGERLGARLSLPEAAADVPPRAIAAWVEDTASHRPRQAVGGWLHAISAAVGADTP